MTDLGTLGSDAKADAEAYGINASGQVVGYAFKPGYGATAFLYSGGVMADLNLLLPPNSGWSLGAARQLTIPARSLVSESSMANSTRFSWTRRLGIRARPLNSGR
jgi:probable HAF family extracellular repeat protein